MKPTVAIIQARMGSQRFPGKMAASLGNHAVLEWVLHRVSQAQRLDRVILATSTLPGDDRLVATARAFGIDVCRDSETDVLGRFVAAARMGDAHTVVRICADNPFIDPQEIDRLITFFQAQPCDCACNHLNRLGSLYADGFGAEILGAAMLYAIAARTTDPADREHVTRHLWNHPERYDLRAVPAPAPLAHPLLRFDIDTPEDLTALQRLVDAGVTLETPAARIVTLALALPPVEPVRHG